MKTMNWIRKLLYVLAVGTPCFFLSEGFFWARWRTDFNPLSAIPTWLMYCFVMYSILIVLDQFKVQNFWGIFLASAVYGWLVEGVLVNTLYEDFPLGISFTGLAWHALLSVGIGLYALPRLLRRAKPGKIAWLSAAAGLIYAVWAIWWWLENPDNINHPLPWLLYSGGMTLLAMLAWWAAGRLSREHRFDSSKTEAIIVLVVWCVAFVIARFFSFGWGLLVLPPLMALTLNTLRPGKRQVTAAQSSVLEAMRGDFPLKNLLAVLALPLSAFAMYSLAYFLGLALPTNILFYIVLTPAGFVLYILALVKLIRQKSTIKAADEPIQGD